MCIWCCAGVCNIFKFIVSLGAIILRVYRRTNGRTDWLTDWLRHDHCNYQRCATHLDRVHFHCENVSFTLALCVYAVELANFHLRRHLMRVCVFCLVIALSHHSHTHSHTHELVHRFVFILFDTLAKWNCLFNPWLHVLYSANWSERALAQLCHSVANRHIYVAGRDTVS